MLNHSWTSGSHKCLERDCRWGFRRGSVWELYNRHGLAPREMEEFLHRLQTALFPVSLCFTQSLGIGVELHIPRGHPKLFFGLNEQVIIGYLNQSNAASQSSFESCCPQNYGIMESPELDPQGSSSSTFGPAQTP